MTSHIILALAIPFSTYAAEKISFNRDIRPILSENCFYCHGPDAQKQKANLRLDQRDAALKGGESGHPAIQPGKPAESEMIKNVLSTDPDEHMPPKKTGKTLKPEQIELLKKWVAEGAEYQGHWAFLKPVRPQPPAQTANPIDAFILKTLGEQGLKPSPEAPRETLIRRAALDLTGIPPKPEEVDAFLADQAPNAYEKVVDRLLASPRYGERMAAQWLDFARYADSNGFQGDSSRQMSLWRDWVIGAFNRNMPFNQFTIEQLGGDLLPNATTEQIVATGFNRNHRLNGEGGRIIEEWLAETVIDRVETTGQTWMALTLGCARCHDHKFDPVSQKEFYQLFAFFNSNDESGVIEEGGNLSRGNSKPFLSMPTPEQAAQIAKLDAEAKAAEARMAEAVKELPKSQAVWEQKQLAMLTKPVAAWAPLTVSAVKSAGKATFTKQNDGTLLASGPNVDHDIYTITAPIVAGIFSGLLIEVLPDASLPQQSLGRFSNGNFVLTDVDATITATSLAKPLDVVFTRAEADYQQKGYEVKNIVQDKDKRAKGTPNKQGWAVDGPTRKLPCKAIFVASAPVTVPASATITITLRHDAMTGHNMGRFRLSSSSLPPAEVKLDGTKPTESFVLALKTEPLNRTEAQRAELAKNFNVTSDTPVKQVEKTIAAKKKARDDIMAEAPSTMVMKEIEKPRAAYILKRGEYDKLGDAVERGLPAALPPMPAGAPMNRLGFAQWLVSGEHPLTARVWVNRAWERFFGMGLVKTSENFGSQAEWPSHPELLDWMATEFVRLKWDMKAMQKTIVMSATYRQSARSTPALIERDPENRLLARGPRFRLTGEALRDQALAVSGLLVEKIGGPSVRPYMPPAVWDETSVYGDMRGYKADAGEGLYRRTLYTIWKRTAAPPSMQIFDSPTREVCTVKRSRTNTPLQALSLLNEVTYVEAARRLAERMLTEGGATPGERIAWGFRRATSRKPDAAELKILTNGVEQRLAQFRQNAGSVKQLISFGESKPPAALDPAELAAYSVAANVILNLDEVITRE